MVCTEEALWDSTHCCDKKTPERLWGENSAKRGREGGRFMEGLEAASGQSSGGETFMKENKLTNPDGYRRSVQGVP